jgi:hypothetical protein
MSAGPPYANVPTASLAGPVHHRPVHHRPAGLVHCPVRAEQMLQMNDHHHSPAPARG